MVMVLEPGAASEVSADGLQAVGLRHVAAPPSASSAPTLQLTESSHPADGKSNDERMFHLLPK